MESSLNFVQTLKGAKKRKTLHRLSLIVIFASVSLLFYPFLGEIQYAIANPQTGLGSAEAQGVQNPVRLAQGSQVLIGSSSSLKAYSETLNTLYKNLEHAKKQQPAAPAPTPKTQLAVSAKKKYASSKTCGSANGKKDTAQPAHHSKDQC